MPLLARWTTNFDCPNETNYWYCILDHRFEIDSLKAKKRYEIRQALKNFDCKNIDCLQYSEQLYACHVAALGTYRNVSVPTYEKFCLWLDSLNQKSHIKVYGAFFKSTKELAGYSVIGEKEGYVELATQKSNPALEKYNTNTALVYAIIQDYNDRLGADYFINDGARNILHETNFQSFLESKFGFRKAYCNLRIIYNPKIKWIIKLIYPFRKLLRRFEMFGLVHKINGVLKMEEIQRIKTRK